MRSIERIIVACCDAVGLLRSQAELSVNIVNPARMLELNRRYLGKNRPTDVLSFPIGIKHDILYLGDIFINRSDAKKNLPFLVVHGFLHLMGYDHEQSLRAKREMFRLQDSILKTLGHGSIHHFRH